MEGENKRSLMERGRVLHCGMKKEPILGGWREDAPVGKEGREL